MERIVKNHIAAQPLSELGVRTNAAGFPLNENLYLDASEHDACGVGLLAHLDNVARHSLIEQSLSVLVNLEHRGALGGDNVTGDGAGLMVGIPDKFFRKVCKGQMTLPAYGDYGVAMVFLPVNDVAQKRCIEELEIAVMSCGLGFLGWRDVPINSDGLGDLALSTMPVIKQLFVANDLGSKRFESKLCVARRLAEKSLSTFDDMDVSQFYVCSFSSKTIVYKGMLTGRQLRTYYPDLTDEDFESSMALVHQRYSTNTLPTWQLAQPFRLVAHNGEINTIRGNVLRMRSREGSLQSDVLGDDIEAFKPVIDERGSDSGMFDNALELLVHTGRSLPHAMCMMVPEAWGRKIHMSSDKRAFYEFHSAVMEPWDGPAAFTFCDGRFIGGTLDRNGLRPCRYQVTRDGFVVMASEIGVVDLPPEQVLRSGRLIAGNMFLIDLQEHRIVPDKEVKSILSRRKPYRHWVHDNHIALRGLFNTSLSSAEEDSTVLRRRQIMHGYTREDEHLLISPMASFGQEPIGSMGNDVALAVLSKRPQLLFEYFKQLFAQVTNPPIDPLREEMLMSVLSWLGRSGNLLAEDPSQCNMLRLRQPILTSGDLDCICMSEVKGLKTATIDILFPANGDGNALRKAIDFVFSQADAAISAGNTVLVLSDRNADEKRVPIPVLLVVSGLHHYLIRSGRRNMVGIIADTGEVREVIHYAMLIAFGTNAICPYVALDTVQHIANNGFLENDTNASDAIDNYITAVKKGLLKTFSRMGISTIRSFFGSQIFEAVGLGSDIMEHYFPSTVSRIGGIGLDELAADYNRRHAQAYSQLASSLLDVGGQYQVLNGGEAHLFTPTAIYHLQQAVRRNNYEEYKLFSTEINEQAAQHITLRSLFDFVPGTPVPLDEVESEDSIIKRFVCSAMSYGSLSDEAHKTIAIAMNRLGGMSNCGEGGEDPRRYVSDAEGNCLRSRIKQIASGRFGVTDEYLVNADELQVKVAQGAKPGEGGQLPGHKVSVEIARVRHTTTGVTLISPPPHHDIYSIEDLAQLIYDLKSVNKNARVSVKLVSEAGVGTIASGVAKAGADMVLISGHDGGTGASPLTAVKHVGLPWELGLAEAHKLLCRNGLRGRIRVQTDGQLRTGRDLAIATLLGAEEYGFATVVLVTLGCAMMRKCHLNTCPLGVATQNSKLRANFKGKPEHIINYFRFLAHEFREEMASLGFRSIDEMVGHSERLSFDAAKHQGKERLLDFSRLFADDANHASQPKHCEREGWRQAADAYDDQYLDEFMAAADAGKKIVRELKIRNTNRAIGTRLSGDIARKYGYKGLPDGTITLKMQGIAGQSLGAFLANGVSLLVEGGANDYLGKGMSGGQIAVRPPAAARYLAENQVIVGNVMLYGATGGRVFVNGIVGERFCVRNSGATAVVEGVGDHACEYMTGGIAVVLGNTGINFAAGMSGGVAYVYDATGLFDTHCNLDMVDLEPLNAEDMATLKELLSEHCRLTGSVKATMMLKHWESEESNFVKVMPIDYKKALERMSIQAHIDDDTVTATEEVL